MWYATDYPRTGRRNSYFNNGLIARLAPGVTLEEARAELEAIARSVQPEDADAAALQAWRLELVPLHEFYTRRYSQTLYLLFGAVGFVLLIAMVNVANLQLSRGVTRQSEMSTRVALGAGRWRLLRQVVTENILLGLMGGGVAVAYAGVWIFLTLAPEFYARPEPIQVNGPVLLFTLGVSLVAGILSGLIPALRASKPDLLESLKQGAPGHVGGALQRIRRGLVAVEVAMALVLLVGAGLMINSYVRLMTVDMGLDPDSLLTMEISLASLDRYAIRQSDFRTTVTPEVTAFFEAVMDRIAFLPGVRSVAMTSGLPPNPGARNTSIVTSKVSLDDNAGSFYDEISGNYFETMGIPLVRGRTFTDQDSETGPGVAIINETMAREFFPGTDPIGQYLEANIPSIRLRRENPYLEADRPREVVGIVQDARIRMRTEAWSAMYVPYQQHVWEYANPRIHVIKTFVIRTAVEPMDLALAVRQVVAEVDSSVFVAEMMPMLQRLSGSAENERLWLRLLSLFAGLAVFLAATGIYGVMSYSVRQRTHEFGLRTALGASKWDILTLVMREGFVVTMIGLVIGVGGAFGLTRLISNQLFGVTPMDPMTIAAVAMLLVVVTLVACYIPGRHATKLDPSVALRIE